MKLTRRGFFYAIPFFAALCALKKQPPKVQVIDLNDIYNSSLTTSWKNTYLIPIGGEFNECGKIDLNTEALHFL